MSASTARSRGLALAGVVAAAVLAGGAGLAGGCSSTVPPACKGVELKLTQVYWVAGGTPQLVWSRASDPGLQPAVAPLGTEIAFVFSCRLDGDLIEDTVTVNGVVTTRPKAMPPIMVTWPDMAKMPGDPPLALLVSYSSTASFGGYTSYVVARPAIPGFPANETLSFVLDRGKLANEYGDLADTPPSIPIVTTGFTVEIKAPTRPVTTRFQLPLVFSNRLPRAAAASPFVHVTNCGAAVPSKLLADASDPARVYVVSADSQGVWPDRATLTVTIDPALTDAFGRPLATGATATFATGAGAASPPDAACAIDGGDITDGGADDGAAADAGEVADAADDSAD